MPSQTPTTAPSSATPTPTPTATVSAPATKPALSTLVLSPEGLGPIVIGQAIESLPPDLAVAVFDDTFCDFGDSGDHGGWKPNYDLTSDGHWAFLPEGAATASDPVTNLTVQSTEIRTASGIGIGSTVAEVKNAYKNLQSISSFDFTGYSIPGTKGQLVLWFDGQTDTVTNVEVLESGVTPEFRFEIGGCA